MKPLLASIAAKALRTVRQAAVAASLTALALAGPGTAAAQDICGFDLWHAHRLAEDPDYAAKVAAFDDLARNNTNLFTRSSTTHKIPIVVHVMEDGTSATILTDEEIRLAVQRTNEMYRKVAGSVGDGNGVDVGIEFVLAVRDPDGNCTSGINRVDMRWNSQYVAQGMGKDSPGVDDLVIKTVAGWDRERYLNIWVVNRVRNGSTELAGYASYAADHGTTSDGTVVRAVDLRAQNIVLAHELGHNLNLLHTFEGSGPGATCPPNADCTVDGDRVCDTPPHVVSDFVPCTTFGPNSCDGGSSTELFRRNYMDYTVCANKFTAGQAARATLALSTYRASLLAANGNMALVPPAAPSNLDILVAKGGCTDEAELTVSGSCLPTTFLAEDEHPGITVTWSITNGTNTYTGTGRRLVLNGLALGLYSATVTVTTPFGSSSRTETGILDVVGTTSACVPVSNSTVIGTPPRIRFLTVDAAPGWFSDYDSPRDDGPSYTDQFCTQSLFTAPAAEITVTVRLISAVQYLKGYIDYNNNGVFEEPSELILGGPSTIGAGFHNFDHTPPPGAVQGVRLRMRVALDTGPITTAQVNCATPFAHMDVRDYGVTIGPYTPPVPTASVGAYGPSPFEVNYGTPITFTAAALNGGGTNPSFTWYINGAVAGTGSSLTVNGLVGTEQVWCEMTSSLANVVGSPARSQTVYFRVKGAPLTAFDAYPRTICPGEAVTFIDRSALRPTSWSWSFPGGTPSVSTAQYPTVTYASPGTYPVTLTASNGFGPGNTSTRTGFITVLPQPPSACSITRSNTPMNGHGVDWVRLATLIRFSPSDGPVMDDQTCWNRPVLEPGTTYAIGVRASGTHANWVRVYIDYNRNGSFSEPGETVFSPANGTGIREGFFTTPPDPLIGLPLRVRVISDALGTTPGPCTSPLLYGQVEEYTVIFEQNDCQGTPNGTALPGAPCNDQQACTLYDVWDVNCDCVGVPIADNDADGICNPFDPCVNGPNPGTPCNDGNPCTTNDVVQAGCGCAGTPLPDTDGDGICNAQDNCPNAPGQVGSPCDDGNPNTFNDVLAANCQCGGLPGNDNTCNAVLLGVGVNGPFSNAGTTAQQGEPQPPLGNCTGQGSWCSAGGPANNSVWFSFVAPPSGRVSLDFGSTATWDSRIALWSATSCSSLLSGGGTLLAANDDLTGAFPYHAGITPLCVTPGQTYYVQVDGWGTVTNSAFQLVLVEEPPVVDASVVGYPAEACPGYQALFTITGTPGAQVTYSLDWGQPITAPLTNGTHSFYTGGLSAPATLALFSVTDGTCSRGFDAQSDQAVVTLAEVPVIGAVTAEPTTLCAGNIAQLEVAMESGATYCNTGLYTAGCLQGDMITAVQFADLARTSGCDGGGAGYSLISSHEAHVQAGQAYAFSMTTGSAAPQGGAAWVDWDQDGQFEGDELLVSGYLGSNGATYGNPSCLVPPTARNGRTRMRVRAIYGSNPGTLTCASWDHGEIEDYYVHVTGGQGTYTYSWMAGAAVAQPQQAATASLPLSQDGVFLVSVANEQGCVATGSVQVTVQRPPQVLGLIPSDTNVCAGGDVQLQLAVAPSTTSCLPGQLLGACATDEHIVQVSFGGIANTSGCSLPGGYEDHTSKATTVAAGATGLTGSVTIAQAFTGDQVAVWFDWDQDGDLTDAGEAATMSGGPSNWTFSVNVPANARDGAARMRVRLTYQSTPQPCGTSNYGETEDYSVIVTGGTQPVGYVWSPIDALSSSIAPNPLVNDLQSNINYIVTVTGPTGCSSQAGISLLVDGEDADGDGMGDCTDPCPAIAGGPGSPCDDGDANTLNDEVDANCTCTGTPAALLQVRMVLEGPYASAIGLMNDALRTLPDFPLTEPYTALGYTFAGGGGGESIAPAVLQVSGTNAIVDWVVVELRDRLAPATVIASRSALLQRDGDVVDLDGTSAVAMAVPPNGYLLAVRHRNHLGIMAANPVPLFGEPIDVDLTLAGTAVHGTQARKDISGAQALWAGDVTFNEQLKYAGGTNDRDPILVRIGGALPTATVSGYHREDCTLDGLVKYAGAGNDRDVILINVGGSVPTAIRQGQLP
ncbi:MAG: PKD domain-containing protein [Flavobacteriales bacterium]|nr:PKD domain-containing protein [Flavobacteriales bacterium]